MPQSQQQLITRALKELDAIGNSQGADADDARTVSDEITPLMSDLAARNIYQWGDPDQIDDAAFVHIAKLLANSVATQFGKPQDENVRLLSEQRLRELWRPAISGQPQRVDYY